jgi:hypothetical protein
MKKLTASLFTTIDGVVGGEEEMSVWHFPYFSDELGAAAGGAYEPADTILLGRVTYDSFAGAWPDREAAGEDDAAFAKELGDKRKVVVSKQPLELTWRNSEQLQGDLVAGVTALKAGGPAAPDGPPDRRTVGLQAVRRGRDPDPAPPGHGATLRHRRDQPGLRAHHRPHRGGLRRCQAPPPPGRELTA